MTGLDGVSGARTEYDSPVRRQRGRIRLACAFALAIIIALPLAGNAATPKDALVIAISMTNLVSLDPALSGELESSEITSNAYDRLIDFDAFDHDAIKPRLADSWTIAPDGTITFKLHPGATFQSGNPVTADDVAWTFKRLVSLNLEQAARLTEWGYTPQNVDDDIKAVDPTTLIIKPVGPPTDKLVAVFGQPPFDILDRKVVESHANGNDWGHAWLNTHAAGSGPFSLVNYQPNDIVVMKRFDGYWRGPAKLSRVILRHIPESQVQRLQIERGDVDVAFRLTAGDLDAASGTGTIKIAPALTRGFYYLGVNTLDPLFANKDVREALHWLVDPEALSKNVAGHFGPETRSLPIFRDEPGGLPDEPWHYDPEKARALLKQAGYPDGFSATLLVLPDSPFIELATAVQASMAAGGVKIAIKSGTGNIVYGAARQRTYQMILGRGSTSLPFVAEGVALEFMYNPDNTPQSHVRKLAYRSGFQDPRANDLLDKLKYAATDADTAQIDEQLQKIFIADAWPYMLLVRRADPIAIRNEVRNYVPSPFWVTRWDVVSKQ
jgi:peptide/nickel transport system substrate-binding protein